MDRDRPGSGLDVHSSSSGGGNSNNESVSKKCWPLLQEALALEPKFQPYLELRHSNFNDDDVTIGLRDGSAHVLRCLKVWYDLPSDVFFIAVNLMDRFLTRMKVRPRHMACISASSLLLATKLMPQGSSAFVPPDPHDLITISQCKCSLGDLERMQAIITNKLETEPGTVPVTAITFVRLICSLMDQAPPAPHLIHHLEILACDSACVNFRPSQIALSLFDAACCEELHMRLGVTDANEFAACSRAVRDVLARYHAHAQVQHRQQLIWRLSNRTLRQLRPTCRLTRLLPTISENQRVTSYCHHESSSWPEDDRPPTTFRCDDE